MPIHPHIAEQLDLAGIQPAGEELLLIDQDKRSNRCTAASLDARAGLRAAILAAVAEGHGSRRVAQAFGVSREVVRALHRQALGSGELDHAKKTLAADALALAHRAIDRMADEIDEMPRSSLPIVAGVMVDKAQLLSGGVTARVERVSGADVAEVANWLKSVIDVSSSAPVEQGDADSQKGLAGLPSASIAGLDQVAYPLTSDTQSPVFCPSYLGNEAKRAGDGQNSPQKEGNA